MLNSLYNEITDTTCRLQQHITMIYNRDNKWLSNETIFDGMYRRKNAPYELQEGVVYITAAHKEECNQ